MTGQPAEQPVKEDVTPAALSPCDVKALQKCLEENNGDHKKCLQHVQAFQVSCSKRPDNAKGMPGP